MVDYVVAIWQSQGDASREERSDHPRSALAFATLEDLVAELDSCGRMRR